MAAVIVASSLVAFAQTPTTPKFEVASVKPSDSTDMDHSWHENNASLRLHGYSVRRLIADAHEIEIFQVLGGPAWASSDRYDILAKFPDELAKRRGAGDDKIMLQGLLADRFKLTTHTEFRELPFYALVVAKEGSKVRVATAKAGSDGLSGRSNGVETQLTFTAAPISMLTHYLAQRLERPVVDRTDLAGKYDFKLEYEPDQPGTESSGPSILNALQKQLGLKLEATKGPVEVLVIDHVERPDEN